MALTGKNSGIPEERWLSDVLRYINDYGKGRAPISARVSLTNSRGVPGWQTRSPSSAEDRIGEDNPTESWMRELAMNRKDLIHVAEVYTDTSSLCSPEVSFQTCCPRIRDHRHAILVCNLDNLHDIFCRPRTHNYGVGDAYYNERRPLFTLRGRTQGQADGTWMIVVCREPVCMKIVRIC